ncbi:hypothetical protein [Marinifilum sp. D737]|uniref:hypothetical protein n=1 Tax=Marinifilum sp. D737 TaxID=2969628 RepID=UPI002276EBFD|nr:hypothetical protein [Marinifilum sp. D737]MCY1635069.1 hypothetical protein [Marinifilum sp. D737]
MNKRTNKVIEMGKVVNETEKQSKETVKQTTPTKPTSKTTKDKQDNATAETKQEKQKVTTVAPSYVGNDTKKRIRIKETYNGFKIGDEFKHPKYGACVIKNLFISPNGHQYAIGKSTNIRHKFYGDLRADRLVKIEKK